MCNRSKQRTWLLQAAVETWNAFRDEFLALWTGAGMRGDAFPELLFSGQALEVGTSR